jgi:GPN-loop GTPase
MQRLNVHLHTQRNAPYVLNLDPAVINIPYEANIDIRDSINYKEVMKQYSHNMYCLTVDTVSVQMGQ